MFKALGQAVAGMALLPVAVAIDVLTIPIIANEDRESSTYKVAKSIVKNVEKAATGEGGTS